ncbi:MAG TPA: MFS transporter [Acidimicrobiales bacterium]|nr:MFS transporter [Acidimicrobiales bacterium]
MARLVADVAPLRRYRDFRLLWYGQTVSSMGSQLTVVGVSYQAYRLTHSTFMVGLISLVELLPLIVGSLGGGPVIDATDRRRVILVAQVCMALCSVGLAANALLPHPALWPLFACAAGSALFQGVNYPARRAALTMVVPAADMTAALALQAVVFQWAFVVGPSVAGLLIGSAGLGAVYLIDVGTFVASTLWALRLPALRPSGGGTPADLRSLVEGWRHLRGQRLLAATFWIDLDAMIFGMPRAVFPAIGTGLYHGGAGVVGLLYAAPGVGGVVGSMLSGWVGRVRHQGRAVVVSVCVWGGAVAAFGVVPALWAGLVLLAVAGAADVVSAVFRQAVLQDTVPERLQGRLSGAFFAVVAGGPRLGDAETGAAAALAGPQVAVWSGGLACLAGVALLVWRVPELWRSAARPPTGDQLAAVETGGVIEGTAELSEGEAV